MGAIFDRKTHKLYVYTPGTTEVWARWPAPMAWRKSDQDAGWRHVRPMLSLPKRPVAGEIARCHAREQKFPYKPYPSREEEKAAIRRGARLARLEWAANIPDPVRRAIAPIRVRQWHLLAMAARCGEGALDLIRSNPALAFMLASNWVFHKPAVQQPLRSVRALLKPGRSQVEMLAWLGFPPRPAVRRILARIPPESIDVPRLLYLRDACHDPEALKRMFHLPRLNAGCLRIVTDATLAARITPPLMTEVANDGREDAPRFRIARLIVDTLRARAEIGAAVNGVLPARTIEELEECHDEAVGRLNRLNEVAGCADAPVFPPPPLPGDNDILPITSARELRAEGREMQHCVRIHESDIAVIKNYYVYRIDAPERATLAIRRTHRGWAIAELSGRHNSAVSSETRSRVMSWFESCADWRSRWG